VFEALKDKSRLSAELDSANETIEAQAQEIARLRDALKASADCVKELCACLDEATPWIDPIMIGDVTQTGESTRAKLLDRIDDALIWAGHRKPLQ
jgi:hypothetical protein